VAKTSVMADVELSRIARKSENADDHNFDHQKMAQELSHRLSQTAAK
jgi:hypothetical protein